MFWKPRSPSLKIFLFKIEDTCYTFFNVIPPILNPAKKFWYANLLIIFCIKDEYKKSWRQHFLLSHLALESG